MKFNVLIKDVTDMPDETTEKKHNILHLVNAAKII